MQRVHLLELCEEEDKIMKGVTALPLAAALAIALAACGAGHPTPGPTVTVTSSPQATSAASPAASSVSMTATNERVFADGMSASIPVVAARVVAGPVMRAYIRYQHADGAAWAAVGQPVPGQSVTQIADGLKLCSQASGNGSGCQTFSQFTTNHAGQITGASVDGQPIAGRISTAPAATSDGLTISDVAAYRVTDAQNLVAVAFKLTDDSYRPVNTSPALLASLNGASDETGQDALPATLTPGDNLYAEADFGITQITGLFCLQPNDGFGEHLPCTTLSKA